MTQEITLAMVVPSRLKAMALCNVPADTQVPVTYDELLQYACFAEALIDTLLYSVPTPPDPNCSCHTFPPCSDCVDHGGLRELIKDAKAFLSNSVK